MKSGARKPRPSDPRNGQRLARTPHRRQPRRHEVSPAIALRDPHARRQRERPHRARDLRERLDARAVWRRHRQTVCSDRFTPQLHPGIDLVATVLRIVQQVALHEALRVARAAVAHRRGERAGAREVIERRDVERRGEPSTADRRARAGATAPLVVVGEVEELPHPIALRLLDRQPARLQLQPRVALPAQRAGSIPAVRVGVGGASDARRQVLSPHAAVERGAERAAPPERVPRQVTTPLRPRRAHQPRLPPGRVGAPGDDVHHPA